MKIKIYKNVCDAAKAVLRAKFLVLKDCIISLPYIWFILNVFHVQLKRICILQLLDVVFHKCQQT